MLLLLVPVDPLRDALAGSRSIQCDLANMDQAGLYPGILGPGHLQAGHRSGHSTGRDPVSQGPTSPCSCGITTSDRLRVHQDQLTNTSGANYRRRASGLRLPTTGL